MKIHKLNAINSTSVYLKNLIKETEVSNYTVVSAEFQFSGKGQGANKWVSANGKNLLFSILIHFEMLKINQQAYLNFAVSLGVFKVLKTYISDLKIKWPNDIMAGNKKICGLLIENTVREASIKHSIIGIGLNVNQDLFSDVLNATSLKIILNHVIDKDELLVELIDSIKSQINILNNNEFDELKQRYESVLYKNKIPAMYKMRNSSFMGKIIGVSINGLLQIELENGAVQEFANKEIVYI